MDGVNGVGDKGKKKKGRKAQKMKVPATSASVDLAAVAMSKVTLAISMDESNITETKKEENEDVEAAKENVIPLDLELVTLINASTVDKGKRDVADIQLLLKTVDMVKVYLREEKNHVETLLKYKGFLPFFVKCLQHGCNNSSLQFNTAWIFEVILIKGSVETVESIVDPETVAVEFLVKFLQSPDKTIYEKTTSVLTRLVNIKSSNAQLLSAASSLFAPFAKLLKCKNPSEEFVRNVVYIILSLFRNKSAAPSKSIIKLVQTESGCHARKVIGNDKNKETCHVSRLMKHALPVIVALLNLDSTTVFIRRAMLQCLSEAFLILDDIKSVVDSGCCAKIVTFFSDPKPSVKAAVVVIDATTVTASIAAAGPLTLLSFLRSLKDTGGLENYWKCLKLDSDSYQAALDNITVFLSGVAGVIHYNINGEGIDATIDSGMIDSLIHFIKDKDIPSEHQHSALAMLACMIKQLPIERRNLSAHLLPSALEHFNAHRLCPLASKCIRIMELLLEGSCQRRNEAVMNNTIPTLLDVLTSLGLGVGAFEIQKSILNCIRYMIEVTPQLNLAYFAAVPDTIKDFLQDSPVGLESNIEISLKIIALICAYQNEDAIELVIEADLVPNVLALIMMSFSQNSSNILANAVEVVFNICENGNRQHRKELLLAGVLDRFEKILESGCDHIREMALRSLLHFLTPAKTKLAPAHREKIKSMAHLVKLELDRNVLGTQSLAKSVLSKLK